MRKKYFLWLSSMAVFLSLLLNSCVHDEIYSSSDPASKEYTNKSLWKEDETYIKNVMKIYLENESKIKKISGNPVWDYATTVNNFDESFLMVPVVEGKTVVSVIKVPRHGNKVYFYYTASAEDLAFFQGLVFAAKKRALHFETSTEVNKITCGRQWISIWLPDKESEPEGSGSWYTRSVIVCRQDADQCLGIVNEIGECEGGGGDNNPGYPYPSGGGSNYPQPDPKTPCEKAKDLKNDPEIKAKTNTLYDQSKETEDGKRGEKGFMVKPDGTDGPIVTGGEHSVQFGDITGYQGYFHNHTPKGVKMLSPPDIYKLFQFIVAQGSGTPVEDSFGAMVAAQGNCWTCSDHYLYFTYMIRFNGTYDEAKAIKDRNYTKADLDALKNISEEFEHSLRDMSGYSSQDGNFLSFKGLEEVFFNALEVMGIEKNKMILQRIDKNGNINTITLGADGKPKDIPCP